MKFQSGKNFLLDNKEISRLLKLTAQLTDLHNGNPFKVKSLMNAALKISKLDLPISELSEKEAENIEGIGKGVHQKIKEILSNGFPAELPPLIQKTPPGVIELLNIKGIGPKKVAAIWQQLGIESPGELLYACNENRLVGLKGFGIKTQEEIKNALEFTASASGKYLYPFGENIANEIISVFNDPAHKIEITGQLRRKQEVFEIIELITTFPPATTEILLKQCPLILPGSINISETDALTAITISGIPVKIYFTSPEKYFWKLFETTGDENQVSSLFNKIEIQPSSFLDRADSEKEIYTIAGLKFIPPELREEYLDINFIQNLELTELIQENHLKGILHLHTTYSDGANTLEEMALYCREKGYEYIGVTDHSKSAYYANGLKEEQVEIQFREIEKLNVALSPFKILKGIESDILPDGNLDYTEDVLKKFDFIIASIHSIFKMDEEKATKRLIKAIENPYTTILGHMTGRLLLARKGYPVDHIKVIDACASNQVAIELNANPRRLDMDYKYIQYAQEKGVIISINPDAHQRRGINDVHYGVNAARKGGLFRKFCLNAMSLLEIESYLKTKKSLITVLLALISITSVACKKEYACQCKDSNNTVTTEPFVKLRKSDGITHRRACEAKTNINFGIICRQITN